MPHYIQGTVTVGTTPTLICSPGGSRVFLQNTGSAACFLGGSTVAASGALAGPSLAAAGTWDLPAGEVIPGDLYGIVATGNTTISFAYIELEE